MNLGQIETEVREMFDFPAPATGGTDPLVQATIWKYINDAFYNMVNAIDGIPSYVAFTVSTAWSLSVTVGSATLTSTALDGGDHYALKIAELKTWGDLVNLTEGTGEPRDIDRTIYNERGRKSDQVTEQNYFDEFDIIGHGLVLLPKIDTQNTIGLYFRKKATEMAATDSTPDSEINAEYHNKYPVMYACAMLALSKDDARYQAYMGHAGHKDRDGNYTGMLGDFVSDFQLADLGAESHSIGRK